MMLIRDEHHVASAGTGRWGLGTVGRMRCSMGFGVVAVIVVVGVSCGSGGNGDEPAVTALVPASEAAGDTGEASGERFPDVIDASAERVGATWTVSATLSSPYDTPERYADAWRVMGPDGTVYGERILLHDHANEQPFTRSQSGIEIPDDVAEVTIQGRDLANGYGGDTFVLRLAR